MEYPATIPANEVDWLQHLHNISHIALGIFAFYQNAALTVTAFAVGFVGKAIHIFWNNKAPTATDKTALPLCAIGYASFLLRESLNDPCKLLLTTLGIADCIYHRSPFLISLVGAGAGCVIASKLLN